MFNIVLLQRELRVDDNSLLSLATSQNKPFIPVFIFDKSEFSHVKNKESKSVNFLAAAILNLKSELQKQGSDLLVFCGDKFKIISSLLKLFESENIIIGKTYEQSGVKLCKKLEKVCSVNLVSDSFLTNFDVVKDNGEAFKVYTPYKNEFLKRVKNFEWFGKKVKNKTFPKVNFKKVISLTKSKKLGLVDSEKREDLLKEFGFKSTAFDGFEIGDVKKRFEDFYTKYIDEYAKNRDYPACDCTSKLSPYFRYGLISIRDVFSKCWKKRKNKGVNTWMLELIWREFYATTLYHFPDMQKEEFMEKYRGFKWEGDSKKLKAWKDGKTGYPIVDAGMRQLKETGWMHNRIRMVVASFLTKNLLIDWREGEKHFADYLIDYEPCSNIGGWQWSASVGIDPQPYFRIFSPFSQSKKFDKNAEYIKKYIPELQNTDLKLIHEDGDIPDYYPKIVDYSKSRSEALSRFKAMR